MSPLEQSLLQRCEFPESPHAHCGVSGGADSLALLFLAIAAGKDVTVVHVDHGLRADNETEFVEAIARNVGARFEVRRVDVGDGPNLEARARAARYDVFPEGTLTGHTADDQAETVLLNLMRGSGISGLAGMRSTTKPILNLRRHETEALCAERKAQPFTDPTNTDPRFRRNRVRNELLPLMNNIAERDVVAIISNQTHIIQDDDDLLNELARNLDPTDARAIAVAPPALARRALRNWLKQELDGEQHPPSAVAVERVLGVARGEATATDVANGVSVRRSSQRLLLRRSS